MAARRLSYRSDGRQRRSELQLGLVPPGGGPYRGYRAPARLLVLLGVILLAASCATGRRTADPTLFVPSIWPTPATPRPVTSEFGYRTDPITGQRRRHTGIDIAAPEHSPVVATAYGTISLTGWNRGGYGRLVIIDHQNGYETRYAHLARILVKRGRHVERGQLIGEVGATGRTTGPHLQYEVRINGAPVDPRPYLRN